MVCRSLGRQAIHVSVNYPTRATCIPARAVTQICIQKISLRAI